MRKILVAGNWKLNGSLQENDALIKGVLEGLDGLTHCDVLVCPPFPYLSQVVSLTEGSKLAVGSQDCADQVSGAYTGEVSADMIKEVGCQYIIVGHSERRAIYGEDDAFTARKFSAARKAGMTPILCVGETLEEREAGVMEKVIAAQLDAVIELEGVEALADAVVAYEPVWAIGTGKTASPEQAQEVHAFIRNRVAESNADIANNLQILYGGSVKPGNAAELFACEDIDGGLIGGAALKAEDFLGICRAAG